MSAALTEKAASNSTLSPPAHRRGPAVLSRLALLLGGLSLFAVGCGSPATAETGSPLVQGLPKCDPSLLHPRITVATTAALPGKLIVYVDGVMACLDDASRVDQIVSQVEGRSK